MTSRRHPIWKSLLLLAADSVSVWAGLAAAYWFRFHSGGVSVTKGYRPEDYLAVLPWVWGIWMVALRLENLHSRRGRALDFNVARRIVTGSALAVLMFFAFAFYVRQEPRFSRVLIPVVFVSVTASLLTGRALAQLVLTRLALRGGAGQSRTAIIGTGATALRLLHALRERPEIGMNPVGLICAPDDPVPPGTERLGTPDDLEDILERHRLAEVIVVQTPETRQRIAPMLLTCERRLVDLHIIPDATELMLSAMTVRTVGGIPMLSLRESPLAGWNAALKRLIDVTAAAIGLVLLSPVVAAAAVLIRRADGGPAFYTQERMGLDRRRFRIFKLRTMRPDAERESGPVFAEEDDPRCTPVGAVLRRWRIDEIPQLLNVLRGEMSLVGPRPERPFFVEKFSGDLPGYMSRHRVRTGITGWAQVHGLTGRNGTIGERLEYDLYYIENWSLWLDMKIVMLTLGRTLRRG